MCIIHILYFANLLFNVFFLLSLFYFFREWTANIGAPAALVAGAVLVTLGETREESAPKKTDSKLFRRAKLSLRFLLLSSFALEVISIFVSTMTGSVLLGQGPAKKAIGYLSPLQLLHHHHEFEFLTTQICFLQGLLHWLGAVAIDLWLPKDKETVSAKRMNKSLSLWLVTLIVWMLAFYNHHLTFYSDYGSMLKRFVLLFVKRYLAFRPMALLYVPLSFVSGISTWKAFKSPPEDDGDDDE